MNSKVVPAVVLASLDAWRAHYLKVARVALRDTVRQWAVCHVGNLRAGTKQRRRGGSEE